MDSFGRVDLSIPSAQSAFQPSSSSQDFWDWNRLISMADEGGFAGAVMENQEGLSPCEWFREYGRGDAGISGEMGKAA